jgi:hypothetical protein
VTSPDRIGDPGTGRKPGPRGARHRRKQRGLGFRVGWWLASLAVVALGGWGIGQLVGAARSPGAPPALPEQVLAMPTAGVGSAEHVTSSPSPLNHSVPSKIIIPAIGLRADIDQIGLRPDGALETPSFERANRAAWYRLGPSPGEAGPAVIIGHVDTKKGPAVFYYLTKLHPGDKIEVERTDGVTAIFTIDTLESFPKSEFPTNRVYGGSPAPLLRLITCGGRFDASRHSYVDNIVAFAHLTAVRRPPPPRD